MQSVEKSADFGKAKTRALKILSLRDHSGGELLAKLGLHFERETCEAALEWVREIGYQDDEKFAEKYAALLIKTKRYGVRKARWELKRKGLAEDVIDAALEAYDGDEITGIITGIIERKYVQFLNDRAGIKKTVDALARRGYDYDDIKAAVSRVRDGLELTDD
jgi:regulatory protein